MSMLILKTPKRKLIFIKSSNKPGEAKMFIKQIFLTLPTRLQQFGRSYDTNFQQSSEPGFHISAHVITYFTIFIFISQL